MKLYVTLALFAVLFASTSRADFDPSTLRIGEMIGVTQGEFESYGKVWRNWESELCIEKINGEPSDSACWNYTYLGHIQVFRQSPDRCIRGVCIGDSGWFLNHRTFEQDLGQIVGLFEKLGFVRVRTPSGDELVIRYRPYFYRKLDDRCAYFACIGDNLLIGNVQAVVDSLLEGNALLFTTGTSSALTQLFLEDSAPRVVRVKRNDECSGNICHGDEVFYELEPQIIGTVEEIHTELNQYDGGPNPNCGKDFIKYSYMVGSRKIFKYQKAANMRKNRP